MLTKHFIFVVLIIHVCNGENINPDNTNYHYYKNNEDPKEVLWETEVLEDLAGLKAEYIGKIDALNNKIDLKLKELEINIPKILENVLEKKLNVLLNNNNPMEETIDIKLQNLETNIINKLENYVDSKLFALSSLRFDSDGNIIYEPKLPASQILTRTQKMIDNSLIKLEHNILTNTTTYFESNTLANAVKDLGNEFKRSVPYMISMDKKAKELENNLQVKLDLLETKLIHQSAKEEYKDLVLDIKIGEVKREIPVIQEDLNKMIDILGTRVPEIHCKLLKINTWFFSPYKSFNDEALNHVTVTRDSNGDLTYLDMFLAVKSGTNVYFALSPREPQLAFQIAIYNDTIYLHRLREVVIEKSVPDLVTLNEFTFFHFNIDNGTLKFSMKGSSAPLLTYSDPDFKTIKYYSFGSSHYLNGSRGNATVIYDCPSAVYDSSAT